MRSTTWIGLSYGLVLGVVSFLCTGAGHGTYVPTAVSSAPLGLFGVPAAPFGAPVLWAVIGALLARGQRNGSVGPAFASVLVHYAGVGSLIFREPFGDWDYFVRFARFQPGVIVFGLLAYVAGQVWVWSILITEFRRNRLAR